MKIISRADARLQKKKFFYLNDLCKRNHNSVRLVSNGNCYECSKLRTAGKLKNEMQEERRIEQERINNLDGFISRSDAISQGKKQYFTGKPCPKGHIAFRSVSSYGCVQCVIDKYYEDHEKSKKKGRMKAAKTLSCLTDEQKEERSKKRKAKYQENISEMRKKAREQAVKHKSKRTIYKNKNKEHLRKKDAEYRLNNADRIKQSQKDYRLENADKIKRYADGYSQRHDVKISKFARRTINRLFYNWKGQTKRAEKILGYNLDELKSNLEKKFQDGMSWDNYSRDGWHIDHVKPIKAFMDDGISDPKIINALDNLQPLWAQENLSKGAKYER